MARFIGDGSFTIRGQDSRIYDCEFRNAANVADALIVNSAGGRVETCRFAGMQVGIDVNSDDVVIANSRFTAIGNIGVNVDADNCHITGNTITVTSPDPIGQGVLLNTGIKSRVIGNHITVASGAIGIEGGSAGQIISDNHISVTGSQPGILIYERGIIANNEIDGNQNADGIHLGGFASEISIADNRIYLPFHGIVFTGSAGVGNKITDNWVYFAEGHGIDASNGTDGIKITNNRIQEPGQDADNTYDGIMANGDRNRIVDNTIIGDDSAPQPRYGISVAGDVNIVVGNSLGDPSNYGTDALNNAGTNTELTYPNDATYGDNFT